MAKKKKPEAEATKYPFDVISKIEAVKPAIKKGDKLTVTATLHGPLGNYYSGTLAGSKVPQAFPVEYFE